MSHPFGPTVIKEYVINEVMPNYITLKIPEELRALFEKVNEDLGLGYTSFAEFVKEAIRRRVEELRYTYDKVAEIDEERRDNI